MAQECARDAASYVHPRLTAVTLTHTPEVEAQIGLWDNRPMETIGPLRVKLLTGGLLNVQLPKPQGGVSRVNGNKAVSAVAALLTDSLLSATVTFKAFDSSEYLASFTIYDFTDAQKPVFAACGIRRSAPGPRDELDDDRS